MSNIVSTIENVVNPPLMVQKADGDWQEFSTLKLERLLHRLQIPEHYIKLIEEQIIANAQPELSTQQIADLTYKLLKELPGGFKYAARYNLKYDLRKLGPEGHNFEKYVARLLAHDGYQTQVGQIVQGKCVSHEVDVIAQKDHHKIICECKFHNKEFTRSEVTVAMYVYARYLDIKAVDPQLQHNNQIWLATNTKLTTDALTYARCMGMGVLNVLLPENNSILDRVIKYNLFPISSIPELHNHITTLFQQNIVTIQDLLAIQADQITKMGLTREVLIGAQDTARQILADDNSL